ncbi:RdgB/HAM1 family non-canonical purine NTP pyrophosphatase [Georgenia sp. Z1344]|uniref:RdgB/HAM1 family non-canonical purine NTP pyrophosphatase n=1 Tax=Georgenia sp. Z1344 TaxID=3416706 RepID=UPI003CF48169
MRPRLVLATHNPGKLAELREILAPLVPGLAPEEVVTAGELGIDPPVEDGVTFEANALLKARAIATASGLPAVADDSGLAVDVLGGSPGVFSARWSGRHGDDAANNALLLAQLADVSDEHRAARFVCAAALVVPGAPGATPVEVTRCGEMPGRLLREARGSGGFGYDPLFLPDGETRSAAELAPAEKHAISHRGAAFRALAPDVVRVLDAR